MNKVNIKDIECNIGFEIKNQLLRESIESSNLLYENIKDKDYEDYILNYIKILSTDLVKAGKDRSIQWEDGWLENFQLFQKSGQFTDLIPKYHSKNDIAKINGKIVKTYSEYFDYYLNSFFVDSILLKYADQYGKIFDFGCGTGYHLFRLERYDPSKQYFGLDWTKASQSIIESYSKHQNKTNITGINFNYFDPDYSVDVKDSLIYTVASLEQIGENHDKFIDFILKKKPGLCINFEPIEEVLDENNLIDYLTIKYFNKRNYLKNYLTKLKSLEKEGKVEILSIKRLNYGSKFIEGHTLIIWKPI
jgi:SAM-dependent methyltransferase